MGNGIGDWITWYTRYGTYFESWYIFLSLDPYNYRYTKWDSEDVARTRLVITSIFERANILIQTSAITSNQNSNF